MTSWNRYIEFEKKHVEDVDDTKKFFHWVLKKFGKRITDRCFSTALEVGSGLAGGYLSILPNVGVGVSVDPLYGMFREKVEDAAFVHENFDLIIISNTLSHCDDLELTASNITAWLKRKGLLFVFNYLDEDEKHPHSFSSAEEVTDPFGSLLLLGVYKYPKSKRGAFVVAMFTKKYE